MLKLSIDDPFIWMENVKDEKVSRFVEEENKRLREFLGDLPKKLYSEIEKYYNLKQIIYIQPVETGYFVLERDRNSYNIVFIDKNGEKEKIVSSLEFGKDYIIQYFIAKEDGSVLAYSYSYGGADVGKVRFIDMSSREMIDELEGSIWSIVWLDKNKYYYVRFFRKEKTPDGVNPPATRIFLRQNELEEMIFGHGLGTAYFLSLQKSNFTEKAIVTSSYGWKESTIYGGNLGEPDSWKIIFENKGVPAHPIDFIQKEYLIAIYDKNGLGRIIAKREDGEEREVIGEWDYPLQDATVTERYLIVHYLVDASSILRIYDLGGRFIRDIKFTPSGSIRVLFSNGKEAVFKYESFWIPYRIYRLKDDLELIDKLELEKNYIVKEGFVESNDGTNIHYFEVKRKNARDKKALIYGYGGFRISITPSFSPVIIPFLDNDGTYVVANLRGGLEYGEKWHIAGMRENKQNVFNDFISVIQHYKESGYMIVAMGRSNGGLLVGATMTQRPDLLDGAVIGYPVLDMLRFHKLYIGAAWIPEYGNPDDPKDREFLIRYSPYHNIRKDVEYPLTLVYTGLYDDRVHPAHAFKFVARLKDIGASVYLRTETTSGHAGAAPEVRLRENSDILAFVYKALKLNIQK